jgi:hypothetical protein
MTIVAVVMHDMAKDGLLPDRDHGLRNILGILPDASPKATAK